MNNFDIAVTIFEIIFAIVILCLLREVKKDLKKADKLHADIRKELKATEENLANTQAIKEATLEAINKFKQGEVK